MMNNPVESNATVVKSANDARQAVTGHGVRYVLIISIGAAVILLATTLFLFMRA